MTNVKIMTVSSAEPRERSEREEGKDEFMRTAISDRNDGLAEFFNGLLGNEMVILEGDAVGHSCPSQARRPPRLEVCAPNTPR
jgi:hypothetical protein